MSIEVQVHSLGLCTTCDNSPDCGFRKRRGFDAIFCETFDGDGASDGASPSTVRGNNPTGPEKHSPPAEKEMLKGLCVNCEHRFECTFAKPEGGVWHCEEYR